MLTNKKFVRLAALVMALLMTVAVFAGCSNKQQLEDLQSQIDASEQAAKDAAAKAEAAQKEAEEQNKALQDLLDDLKNKLEEGFKNTDEGIKDVENKVDGYHPNGAETTAPSIGKEEFEGITDKVLKEQKLKSYTELTTLYTVDRADWYTAENYAKLVKIFEEAAYELYRATTIDGIDQVIAEASAAAAAVDSIVSDAAKVQALIDAFGNVETEIFTTNREKVESAREAFDKWVNDYATRFFTKNGYKFQYNTKTGAIITADRMIGDDASISGKIVPIAKDIVDFARKLTGNLVYININDNTNSLLFAEAKIADLDAWALDCIKEEMKLELMIVGDYSATDAEDIVDDLFLSVDKKEISATDMKARVDAYKAVLAKFDRYGLTYSEVKAEAQAIEDAYFAYRVFWNANGGDDSDIAGAPAEKLLTGTEFVKRYVLKLYEGELNEYQNYVNKYLSENVVNFFMGSATGSIASTDWAKNLVYFFEGADGYADNGAAIISKVLNNMSFKADTNRIVVTLAAAANHDSNANTATTTTFDIPADVEAIEKAFNKVASKYYASIFALSYAEDFKGNKSLKDAYVAIDQLIVKAIVEMTQVYYDEIIAPVMVEVLSMYDDVLKAKYTNDRDTSASKDYYNAKDEAFYANVTKLIADAKATVKAFKVPTYDELNTIADADKDIKNIEDQTMFTYTADPAIDVTTIQVYTGDANGNNSAMKTVLEHFAAAMKKSANQFQVKLDNVDDAVWFYDLKLSYAKEIDRLFGDAAKYNSNDKNDLDEGSEGAMLTAYLTTAQKIMDTNGDGKYTELYRETVYKAVNTAAKTARDKVMALEFFDYNTCEAKYAFEQYRAQYKNNKKEIKDLYYTADWKITKDAKTSGKENAAMFIIVDREVVAANDLINTFNTAAAAPIKAFADQVRKQVQTKVADGIELYKTNYSFGDKDPVGVYLEKDMAEYVAYLDGLTGLASVADFSTIPFTKSGELLANDANNPTTDDFSTIDGDLVDTIYASQYVYDAEGKKIAHFNHIRLADVTTAAANVIGTSSAPVAKGWYYSLGDAAVKGYLALADGRAYKGLEDVRKLAYLKDDLINGVGAVKVEDKYNDGTADQTFTKDYAESLKSIMAGFTGYIDEDGVLQGVKTYKYQLGTARTELYLIRLNEAYERIVAAIDAVTLLSGNNKNVDSWKALQNAVADITAIMTQAENATAQYKASTDDFSLAIAYNRYYLEEYDWSKFNPNK